VENANVGTQFIQAALFQYDSLETSTTVLKPTWAKRQAK
jgi:hypothetical protein